MLNERSEYEYYLSGDLRLIPLRNEMFRNNMAGLRRPLQILARGFLGECEAAGVQPEKMIEACRGFLWSWMTGSPYEGFPESLPRCILEKYQRAMAQNLIKFAESVAAKKQHEKIREIIIKKALIAKESPYSEKRISERNDFHEIHFDYMIADALYKGPLQAHCLVFQDNEKSKPFGIAGDEKQRKISLAIIGYYLQEKNGVWDDRPQAFLPIVQAEIGNWVNVRTKKGGKTDSDNPQASVAATIEAARMASTGELLFTKQSMDSCVKIRVNPRWIDMQKAQLIREEAAKAYLRDGYLVFDDSDFLLESRCK